MPPAFPLLPVDPPEENPPDEAPCDEGAPDDDPLEDEGDGPAAPSCVREEPPSVAGCWPDEDPIAPPSSEESQPLLPSAGPEHDGTTVPAQASATAERHRPRPSMSILSLPTSNDDELLTVLEGAADTEKGLAIFAKPSTREI